MKALIHLDGNRASGRVHPRAMQAVVDKSVRGLAMKARIKAGQVVVEQPICGIIFSFPSAVWPKAGHKQRAWVERLTPWWDMDAPDWSPQAHRLRESCVKAIIKLCAPCPENREPLADREPSLPKPTVS